MESGAQQEARKCHRRPYSQTLLQQQKTSDQTPAAQVASNQGIKPPSTVTTQMMEEQSADCSQGSNSVCIKKEETDDENTEHCPTMRWVASEYPIGQIFCSSVFVMKLMKISSFLFPPFGSSWQMVAWPSIASRRRNGRSGVSGIILPIRAMAVH